MYRLPEYDRIPPKHVAVNKDLYCFVLYIASACRPTGFANEKLGYPL